MVIQIKNSKIFYCVLFLVAEIIIIGILVNSIKKDTITTTPMDESYQEYDLLSEAVKMSGFSFDVSKELFDLFPRKEIFSNGNKIIIIASDFEGKTIEIVKSRTEITSKRKREKGFIIGGKEISLYGKDEWIWKLDGFYYAMYVKKDLDPRIIYNIIDQTDILLDAKTIFPECTKNTIQTLYPKAEMLEENGVITISTMKLQQEIMTSRDAKELVHSVSSILGVLYPDTELVFDFYGNNVYHFSQTYGTIRVVSGYVNLFVNDKEVTIQSHYKPIKNLDKTSSVTQEKAKEIIKPFGELRREELTKYIIPHGDDAELAYEMMLKDGRIFYISTKTGEIISNFD